MHGFPKFSFNENLREVADSIPEFNSYITECKKKINQLRLHSDFCVSNSSSIDRNAQEQTRIKMRKTLSLLGSALRILRKLDEAEKAHQEALTLCRIDEVELYINCSIRLAQVYQWKGEFEKANAIFALIKCKYLDKTNNQAIIGTFWQHYGKNKFDQKVYRTALKYFEYALSTRIDSHAPADLLESTQIAITRTKLQITPSPIIEGFRVKLIARNLEQLNELFGVIDQNRSHLEPWMPWIDDTKNLEDLLSYIETAMSWWQNASTYDFTIYLKSSNKIIGSIGLHSLDWEKQSCAVGYWICKSHEGKGFIAEAVKLLETLAINLGFHRMVITCDRLNERSANIPRRLGYLFESLQLDECFTIGKYRDTLTFVKLLDRGQPSQITENLAFGYYICTNAGEDGKTHSIYSELIKNKAQTDSEIKSFTLGYYHETVGTAVALVDKYPNRALEIIDISINDDHSDRGLYARLLSEFISTAKFNSLEQITAQLNIKNQQYLMDFLKMGFLISDVIHSAEANLHESSLILKLILFIKPKNNKIP